MKALSGTFWGKQKETLLATYKAIVRTTFTHGALVWFPNACPTVLNKLQVFHNAGLHVATGCHKKTAINHLHEETKILPVKNQLNFWPTPCNGITPLMML
jgi:hypothetical protein